MVKNRGFLRRIGPVFAVFFIIGAAAVTLALAKPGIVECPGILEPESWIALYAPAEGIVLTCALEEAQWYEEGDLLLRLDGKRLLGQLEQVDRDIEILESETVYAREAIRLFDEQKKVEEEEYRRHLDNNLLLYESSAISRNELEQSRFYYESFLAAAIREQRKIEQDFRRSTTSLVAKRQEAEYLRENLEQLNLYAPSAGFYLALETVYTSEPEMLAPSLAAGRKLDAGRFLGYLIPEGSLSSSIRIPERFAGDCHAGMDVRLSVSSRPAWRYPPLRGHLSEIARFASGGSYRARVDISLAEGERPDIIPLAGASLTARIDIRRGGKERSELGGRLYWCWFRWSEWVNELLR